MLLVAGFNLCMSQAANEPDGVQPILKNITKSEIVYWIYFYVGRIVFIGGPYFTVSINVKTIRFIQR